MHQGELTTEPEEIFCSSESSHTASSGATIRPSRLAGNRRSSPSNGRTGRAFDTILRMTSWSSSSSSEVDRTSSYDAGSTSSDYAPWSTSSSGELGDTSWSETPPTSPQVPFLPSPSSSLLFSSQSSGSRSLSQSRSPSPLRLPRPKRTTRTLSELDTTVDQGPVRPEPIEPFSPWPYASIPIPVPRIPDVRHPDECRGNWVGVNLGRECVPVLTRFRLCTCRWCGRLLQLPTPPANGMGRLGGALDGLVRVRELGYVMSFPQLEEEEDKGGYYEDEEDEDMEGEEEEEGPRGRTLD